jgi:hypothetical protein
MLAGRAEFRHTPTGRLVYRPTSERPPSGAAPPSVIRPEGEWSANSSAISASDRFWAAAR